MNISVPTDVLRKIIADVLIRRGNGILDDADRIAEQEIEHCGVSSEFVGELESTSCGMYVLSDDVLSGDISLEEALNEILSSFEVKLVIQKCIEWFRNHEVEDNSNVKDKEEIVEIHPMLPTIYNRAKREELRKFEQELLKGVYLDV